MLFFLVGTLSGALLGLILQIYWLIQYFSSVLNLNKEEFPKKRIKNNVLIMGMITVVGCMLIGGIIGYLFHNIYPENITPRMIPGPGFLWSITLTVTLITVVLNILFHQWSKQIFFSMIVILSGFGFLLPNLIVIANYKYR